MVEVGIYKELGGFSLEVSLKIKKGSFVAIRGKSGSGKTTLLRILAGLEEAKGAISVEGEEWLGKRTLPPQKRSIGFLFQDYALFPNMTVLENLLYVQKDEVLALKLLRLVDMLSFKERYPGELSGGQKQRIALSRALMRRPKLLLLDEPLSALDAQMRSFLQTKIKELHELFRTTTLMVSHDIAEIYRLADRVITIDAGKVIEDVEKEELLRSRGGYKAEVVKVEEKRVYVAFLGGIYAVSKRDCKEGDIIDIVIKDIDAL